MWLMLLISLMSSAPEVCSSSEFGYEGDYLAGGRARHLGRPVDPLHDIGIAHRTLPLGSVVLLNVPKRGTWVFAVVIDRGPYGRTRPKGSECLEDDRLLANGRCWYNGAEEWRKCRRQGSCYSEGSRWRGCADLTPKTARLLSHDGWERIRIFPVKGSFIPRNVLLQQWGGNV